ncbi:MAG TPA: HAMP domain-containing histidine kinase [Leptolyngbyaceae cyanobacterium M33_DOE_097]|uniref:histidine kinase n=1 Tax=Oscillatoriales cyanobacterium SpSt-418 TaxID=2282169 RepID=A0A7C3PFA4_9CYAN|nr:HAMP domain-containing histidine kinase [Leptolyngbyaceae cyanobacterium M33_DOE_097]
MFNHSRRNLARWFTLSMGSILILFAGVVYYQRSVDRLEETDRLLYKKARVMAANINYEWRQGKEQLELSHVPILGNSSPPSDSDIAYVRWYSKTGKLKQFYGLQPADQIQAIAAFETIYADLIWLRQLTLPVDHDEHTIGYLQIAIPLTDAQGTLRELLIVMVIAIPLTLGVISLTGWFLGGLAMQPIQSSYRQLQRFTSDASHELRAPLAAILSNAQVGLLIPVEDGKSKHNRLERIAETAKIMNQMVTDLLFLARQAGQLDFNSIQLINLNDLLKDTVASLGLQGSTALLTVDLQLPEESMIIHGNPDLLKQAISNLLSNACKYTLTGGMIWLRLFSQYHRILIQVEDTGVGIPEQDLPYVFDRFYRVDEERTREKGGTGLGLAIAQQIVEAHGGRITVSSQISKGTLFQIELPLV